MRKIRLLSSIALLLAAATGMSFAVLQAARPVVHPRSPARHVSVDIDGDGHQDLVRVGHHHLTLHLSHRQTVVRLRALPHMLGIAAADIDRDGDVDLLALSLHGSLRVWKNEGSRGFSSWTRPPPQTAPLDTVSGTTQLHAGLPRGPVAGWVPNVPTARPANPSALLPAVTASWRVHLRRQHRRPSLAVIGDSPRPPPIA